MSPQRSPTEETIAATEFAAYWTGKGYEKGESQPYWLSLLRVLGVEAPERCIEFEDAAHIDAHHGFIDAYIPSTHVLIEQKSLGRNLRAGIPQSEKTKKRGLSYERPLRDNVNLLRYCFRINPGQAR